MMPRLLCVLLPFVPLLLAGCAGPAAGPPPPAPAAAGVPPHYERAFAALRVHPAVQAFAAEHLDPSETLAIEVSSEVVPLGAAARAALGDSLAALAPPAPAATDDALPLLSGRQQRPLVLFFGGGNDARVAAQLYPNPYRRKGFEAVRDGAPGLALLVVFERGAAEVHGGRIAPD
jgi:hypothetical protein